MKPARSVALSRPARATVARRARVRAGTVRELVDLFAGGRRYWLLPLLIVLGAASVLLLAVAAFEYVAPFVYTVF